MKKTKTNLSKRIHMYNSLQDMEKQFAHDVATMGHKFVALADNHFDMANPWDQTVMMAILTNMLAFVEVQAEIDGCNMEKSMKGFYEMNLASYRQQRKEHEKNLLK